MPRPAELLALDAELVELDEELVALEELLELDLLLELTEELEEPSTELTDALDFELLTLEDELDLLLLELDVVALEVELPKLADELDLTLLELNPTTELTLDDAELTTIITELALPWLDELATTDDLLLDDCAASELDAENTELLTAVELDEFATADELATLVAATELDVNEASLSPAPPPHPLSQTADVNNTPNFNFIHIQGCI